MAGIAWHATHFFCFAKKSKQKKATRSLGPYASLRATCGARLRRGLAQTRLRLKQARSLIRLRLRSSAQPGRGNRKRERGQKTNTKEQTKTNKDSPRRVLVASGIRYLDLVFLPHPFWMRRGAQGQTDQGSRCLSEASLAGPRLDRAPQVARSAAEGRSNQGRLLVFA